MIKPLATLVKSTVWEADTEQKCPLRFLDVSACSVNIIIEGPDGSLSDPAMASGESGASFFYRGDDLILEIQIKFKDPLPKSGWITVYCSGLKPVDQLPVLSHDSWIRNLMRKTIARLRLRKQKNNDFFLKRPVFNVTVPEIRGEALPMPKTVLESTKINSIEQPQNPLPDLHYPGIAENDPVKPYSIFTVPENTIDFQFTVKINTSCINTAIPKDDFLWLTIWHPIHGSSKRVSLMLPEELLTSMVYLFCRPAYLTVISGTRTNKRTANHLIKFHRSDGRPLKISSGFPKQDYPFLSVNREMNNACQLEFNTKVIQRFMEKGNIEKSFFYLRFIDETAHGRLATILPGSVQKSLQN